MKKEQTQATEKQVLDLLKKILPKATDDAELASRILRVAEDELRTKTKAAAFDKFCRRVELTDLEPKNLHALKAQLAESFGDADVTLKADRKDKKLAVELSLPEGIQLTGEIRVNPNPVNNGGEDSENRPKFAPFPVCLPGDQELVWLLGKLEDMSPAEAAIVLSRIEEEFWASKVGQKMLRDRSERTFPEFIARVPAGILNEAGLKRHYKTPEPLKLLRNGATKVRSKIAR